MEDHRGLKLAADGPSAEVAAFDVELRCTVFAGAERALAALKGGQVEAAIVNLYDALDAQRRLQHVRRAVGAPPGAENLRALGRANLTAP